MTTLNYSSSLDTLPPNPFAPTLPPPPLAQVQWSNIEKSLLGRTSPYAFALLRDITFQKKNLPQPLAAFLPQEWNDFIWQCIFSDIGDWGWNGVSGCAFLCLCLMSEPLHEANSISKAKISQKCAMRSWKNTHDFPVFGVVSTPYLPNAWDGGFFRPRVILWHRVLPISAKMEGILVSHQSTFPC